MAQNDPHFDALRQISLDTLIPAIDGQRIEAESTAHTTYYATPLGKLQVTPGTDGIDRYHFWSGPCAGKANRGAISFVHDTRFNTLILDNTRTTRPGASLGTISRARARGLWPGRFSLSCPALRI